MKRSVFIFLFASSVFGQTVTSIEPSSAPASGGVFVHIYGTDLIGFALACPSIECANYVKFDDTLGGIAVNSDTEIVALAPAHAAGTVDLTVNIAGKKKIVLPAAFVYEPLDTTSFERILLPIVLDGAPVSGAFGSSWKAEVTLHNASDEDVPVDAPNCSPFVSQEIFCPPPLHVAAGSSASPTLYADTSFGPGVFALVPRRNVTDLDVALRIQDVSRQAQTWGTSIPIVRATDFKSITRLNALPTDSRFRLTLRIYGYDGSADPVNVRLYDPSATQPFVDRAFNLGVGYSPFYPAYLQLDPLAFSQIAPPPVVRLEVSSESDPPKPIWAFVSVTNNETQHVTVIAPSP